MEGHAATLKSIVLTAPSFDWAPSIRTSNPWPPNLAGRALGCLPSFHVYTFFPSRCARALSAKGSKFAPPAHVHWDGSGLTQLRICQGPSQHTNENWDRAYILAPTSLKW
eukprot:1158188-Pelagomonas_calceolata.AAC.11